MDSKTKSTKRSRTCAHCVCEEPTCSSGNPALPIAANVGTEPFQAGTQERPPSHSRCLAPHTCLICGNNCFSRQPTLTPCGHVFCRECIEEVVMALRACPTCAALVFGHELKHFND